MKIVTIVGARPQFVKAAAVSRVIREKHEEILVHTGQHYDNNMSDVFFKELHIPKPDVNLGVGSGTHARQTAEMMIGIEDVLLKEQPDYLMVYGDTNSTLAGAIAASKLHIPIIHVEAGLRSYNMRMPEEQNRILTDRISTLLLCPTNVAVDNLKKEAPIIHVEAGLRSYNMRMPEEQNRILTDRISTLLLCPTNVAVDNLKKEAIVDGVYNVGDVMCDAVLYYSKMLDEKPADYYFSHLQGIYEDVEPVESWYLATVHRAENTDSINKVSEVLSAFEQLDAPVIFPVHPRTKGLVSQLREQHQYSNIIFVDSINKVSEVLSAFEQLDAPVIFPVHPRTKGLVSQLREQHQYSNIIFVEPMGYLDMLYFVKHAKKAVTDSGGLQKETYILDTPCVTVRDQTEWVETLIGNHNILAKPNAEDIVNKVMNTVIDYDKKEAYYGTGHAAQTEWVETLIGNHNILAKPNAEDIVNKVMNTVIDYDKKEAYYGTGHAAKKICELLETESK